MSFQKKIFEKQYSEQKLKYRQSFPFLRKIFKNHIACRDDIIELILKKNKGSKVLDFGCGNGNLLFKIHKQFAQCYGIEILSSRIKEAEQYINNNIMEYKSKFHFKVGDISCQIPFEDNCFDVIICSAVIAWIDDIYSLGKEFRKKLREDGLLLIEFSNFAYFKRRIQLFFGKLPTTSPGNIGLWPEIGWDSGCKHYFTRKTIIDYICQCGFQIDTIKPTGFIINVIKVFPNLFATGWVVSARKNVDHVKENNK